MTPFGILIGLVAAIILETRAENIMECFFDSLAAGTFLYVAFIDIIEEEFISTHDKTVKFISLSFGLGLMAVFALFL